MESRYSAKSMYHPIRLGLLIAILLHVQSGFACTLKSVWEPFEPYQFKNEQGDITGLDIDLLRAVAQEAGCKLKFTHVPWKRALQLIAEGKLHVASGASKTAERRTYAHFSTPYRQETMRLFVQRKRLPEFYISSLDDLAKSPFSIGVALGYTYGKEFDALRDQHQFDGRLSEVTTDVQNIRRLKASRVDTALIEQFVGNQLIQNERQGEEIAVLPLTIPTGDIHFLFSKRTVREAHVAAFDHALERILKNGTYQKIVDRYLPK